MESNQHEESKSSSEETDRSEQNDDMGTGRSYECVFCKRGFTTAQALGGHMNIHRKDRSKPRPSSVPSVASKVDEDLASSRACPSFQTYPPHYPTAYHHEVHINCHPFFPESPWGFRPSHAQYRNGVYQQNRQHLNLFEEDWQKGLSLQIGPPHGEENQVKIGDGSESDKLDLELRLGHDP